MNINTRKGLRTAAVRLDEQVIPIAVIRVGAQGAVLAMDDGSGKTLTIYQPAPRVKVVDTTAAGDCFVGAFTVALTGGQSAADALKFAVYASALKVTKFGAQSGLPALAEVEAFLAQQL